MQASVERIPQIPAIIERNWQHYLVDTLLALAGSLIITAIVYTFHLYPSVPDIVVAYLLVILALASTRGSYAAILAALVAVLSFDFFLVPPLYTFTIARWEEWIALIVFLIVALVTSQLATTMRRSVEVARLREQQARILYELMRVSNSASSLDDQLDIIALSIVRVFSAWGVQASALLVPDARGGLSVEADAPIQVEPFALTPEETIASLSAADRGEMQTVPSSPNMPTASGSNVTVSHLIPLSAGGQVLAVLCLRVQDGAAWFTSAKEAQAQTDSRARFFWTFLDQVTSLMERALLRSKVA